MTGPRPLDDATITITLPYVELVALVAIAHGRGFDTVREYVTQLVRDLATLSPRAVDVITFQALGWTDREIAARMNLTNQAVSTERRRHHLPANRTGPDRKPKAQ